MSETGAKELLSDLRGLAAWLEQMGPESHGIADSDRIHTIAARVEALLIEADDWYASDDAGLIQAAIMIKRILEGKKP